MDPRGHGRKAPPGELASLLGLSSVLDDPASRVREPHRRRLVELLGRDFPEPVARAHWREIERTRDELREALGREVSVALAALDYFERRPADGTRLRLLDVAAVERLRGLSLTDALTGVLNRRGLEPLIERESARARRSEEPLALLAVDLDHFKRVNDQHGHPWGDRVLTRLADLLHSLCRASDAVGRPGGDEFVVVLPGTGIEGAFALAERVRAAVLEQDLLLGCPTRSPGERITVSVGVASGLLEPGELIARADSMLYRAKREGRDRSAA